MQNIEYTCNIANGFRAFVKRGQSIDLIGTGTLSNDDFGYLKNLKVFQDMVAEGYIIIRGDAKFAQLSGSKIDERLKREAKSIGEDDLTHGDADEVMAEKPKKGASK